MSAPQTNIEKQKRWHRVPLIGMALVALFGVAMIIFWLMDESANSNPPKTPDAQGQSAPVQPVNPTTTAP